MKLTDLQREELLTALRQLQADGPVDNTFGICYNVEEIIGEDRTVDAYRFVSTTSVSWPGITGQVDTVDGVPTSAQPIARTYVNGNRTPLWEGKQLEMRQSLIQYLIDSLS